MCKLRENFHKLGYREYNFDSCDLTSEDHIADITLKRRGVTIKFKEMKGDTFESLLRKIEIEENKLK